MTLFQKLKIKLFGKERWRVVDSDEPVKVGDRRDRKSTRLNSSHRT